MSTPDADAESAMIITGVAATLQLVRLSMDWVSSATRTQLKKEQAGDGEGKKDEKKKNEGGGGGGGDNKESTPLLRKNGAYGSVPKGETTSDETADLEEGLSKEHNDSSDPSSSSPSIPQSFWTRHMSTISSLMQFALFVYFIVLCVKTSKNSSLATYGVAPLAATVAFVGVGLAVSLQDGDRSRFGVGQRIFYVSSAILAAGGCIHYLASYRGNVTKFDRVTLALLLLYLVLALWESRRCPYPKPVARKGGPKKKTLSRAAILTILKPYIWPDATSSSAWINRARAILTWFCVIASKGLNIVAPLLLGKASTALARRHYVLCVKYSVLFAFVQLLSAAAKEGQNLVYLRVAQAAFVQLSEVVFRHLHALSLDWHLRKKLGEVIRSMDRGIAACDTLMKYLFLWLVPAFAECIATCIVFATYFDYLPLAVAVFYFVFAYIVWTVMVTLWRKKFRKAVVKSDNEWHDLCTDSLVNFETVKYFTAEEYEVQRFGDAVNRFQSGSVDVQASLSFLNLSQKLILQLCLATSLTLAAFGIKKRSDCCMALGCEGGTTQCCSDLSDVCPGMEVGDFVAVFTYTVQLFAPLNFLGSVYNAIVMAIIDLTNLSELLAESPDLTDAPNATVLPRTNDVDADRDIAVEFDDVYFHYPTQSSDKGLKGLSFKMKRGTTTAVVGPTGAGKTTISRLLFRFYDVLGGAVKVNGVDIRCVTQKSLRGAMGVVPQSASMFNDTLRANVLYGRRDASMEELERAANDAQLSSFVSSLDEGWETLVGERGMKLSGGELQRAAIARCLLKDPPFVVLDEATSALDTITEHSVQEALDRLGHDRTVLIIAHRLGTIRNADNIVVLKDGKVFEQGSHDELMEKDGMYAEMWNMQLHATGSKPSSWSNLQEMG